MRSLLPLPSSVRERAGLFSSPFSGGAGQQDSHVPAAPAAALEPPGPAIPPLPSPPGSHSPSCGRGARSLALTPFLGGHCFPLSQAHSTCICGMWVQDWAALHAPKHHGYAWA